MRLARFAVLAGALALAGCGTLGSLGQTPKQTLTAAHQTHDALAKELDLAATSGWIKGDAAATASHYLSESETYLVQADDALALGQSISGLLDQANADIAKAQPLVPKGH